MPWAHTKDVFLGCRACSGILCLGLVLRLVSAAGVGVRPMCEGSSNRSSANFWLVSTELDVLLGCHRVERGQPLFQTTDHLSSSFVLRFPFPRLLLHRLDIQRCDLVTQRQCHPRTRAATVAFNHKILLQAAFCHHAFVFSVRDLLKHTIVLIEFILVACKISSHRTLHGTEIWSSRLPRCFAS